MEGIDDMKTNKVFPADPGHICNGDLPRKSSTMIPLWYQLWQKRLENTSQDRATLNKDFAAIASQR